MKPGEGLCSEWRPWRRRKIASAARIERRADTGRHARRGIVDCSGRSRDTSRGRSYACRLRESNRAKWIDRKAVRHRFYERIEKTQNSVDVSWIINSELLT
jgi:hypothetical protein